MIRALAALALTLPLTIAPGCASLDLEPPTTINQRIAYAYANATGARTAALNAAKAGRITPDDAAHVQSLANQARAGIDAAQAALNLKLPDTALERLQLAESILAGLAAYLNRKGIQ